MSEEKRKIRGRDKRGESLRAMESRGKGRRALCQTRKVTLKTGKQGKRNRV